MLRFRIIPCLLLKGNSLVKTKRFKSERYIGDPVNTIKIYNESEADEIILLDIDCAKHNKAPNYDLLEKIVSECFMPVCYGGGISSIEIAKRLFTLGIEKLAINHAALSNPSLIQEIISIYGRQSIILSIDVYQNFWGKYYLYSHVKKKSVKQDLFSYIKQYQVPGFGELLVNHVNFDGQMQGYDYKLLKAIKKNVNYPIIALGGAGHINDLKKLNQLGIAAAGAGSLFIYQNKNRSVLINYPSESQLSMLSEYEQEEVF